MTKKNSLPRYRVFLNGTAYMGMGRVNDDGSAGPGIRAGDCDFVVASEADYEIERLRAALREAIAGHKVWESVYGSSPTSRAHLAMLETAVGRQDEPSVEKALQQSSDVLSGRVLQRGPDEPEGRLAAHAKNVAKLNEIK